MKKIQSKMLECSHSSTFPNPDSFEDKGDIWFKFSLIIELMTSNMLELEIVNKAVTDAMTNSPGHLYPLDRDRFESFFKRNANPNELIGDLKHLCEYGFPYLSSFATYACKRITCLQTNYKEYCSLADKLGLSSYYKEEMVIEWSGIVIDKITSIYTAFEQDVRNSLKE